jgi:lysyl-tRNA synthetase class 2
MRTRPAVSLDFRPSASLEMLRFRAQLLRRLRSFFDQRGFLEVDTPLLSRDTVVDLHLDPIPVTLFHDPRNPRDGTTMWLQTSPEFAMKRLIAAGAERIYQITRSFRAGESGPLHNPEFSIVEWYRVGDSMRAAIEFLADLAREMLGTENVETVSYGEAFLQHAGIHPHTTTLDELKRRTRQLGLHPPDRLECHRDAWLNFLLAEQVEPQLGLEQPLILYDYPATQAALARLRWTRSANQPGATNSYPVAERFEL